MHTSATFMMGGIAWNSASITIRMPSAREAMRIGLNARNDRIDLAACIVELPDNSRIAPISPMTTMTKSITFHPIAKYRFIPNANILTNASKVNTVTKTTSVMFNAFFSRESGSMLGESTASNTDDTQMRKMTHWSNLGCMMRCLAWTRARATSEKCSSPPATPSAPSLPKDLLRPNPNDPPDISDA